MNSRQRTSIRRNEVLASEPLLRKLRRKIRVTKDGYTSVYKTFVPS